LSAVVAAHFRALAFIQAQPERASAMMAPRLQLPPDQVPSAFKGLRQPAATESRALLAPDGHLLRQVKTLEGLMLEDGLIGARSDNSAYFETRFHPQS
jgi:ABC-type nitrate/sulfonate/bicarbonate transport system substrate-binding protein